MAIQTGIRATPTTPSVSGISSSVVPLSFLMVTRRMFPSWTSSLIRERSFSPGTLCSSVCTRSSVIDTSGSTVQEIALEQPVHRGLEPRGIVPGVAPQVLEQRCRGDRLPFAHFGRVRSGNAVEGAHQDMIELVFNQVVIQVGAVDEAELLPQRAIKPHFL